MPDFEIFKGNTKQVFKMFRHDNIALVFTILLAIVLGICVAAVSFFIQICKIQIKFSQVYL